MPRLNSNARCRELEELYSNAYVYVLPSELEGMPLSLLEAMSYGNCCLVSDIPENTDVIGDHGISFQTNSEIALAECLQKLADNFYIVHVYKAGVAEYICAKYNWSEITQKTLKLYCK